MSRSLGPGRLLLCALAAVLLYAAPAAAQNGTVSGTITDVISGLPIAGVQVRILTTTGTTQATSVATGANGVYTVAIIPAGTYRLRTLNNAGYADQQYSGIDCSAGTCSTTVGTTITVTSSATMTVNFALAPGARASGTVTAASGGAPIAGVTVSVVNSAGTTLGSAVTNAAGVYTTSTTAFAPGTYFLRTTGSATTGFIDTAYGGAFCPSICSVQTTSAPVVMGAGVNSGLDFSLTRGARISGTVTNASSGATLTGVSITVVSSAGTSVGSAATSTGLYTTSALPTGSYFVRTSNSLGLVDQAYNGVTCISCQANVVGTALPLTAGTDLPGINFALPPGGHVSGTVTDAVTHAAISGVSVQVFNSAGTQLSSATTNATGVYTISIGLPTGQYFVKTSNSLGYLDQLYNGIGGLPLPAVTSGAPVQVNAPSPTTIDFNLTPGGRISGTITDAVTHAGIPGVTVQVVNAANSQVTSVQTNASGVYTTSTGLPTGQYFVRTSNTLGYLDQLYSGFQGLPLPVATTGTPVSVTSSSTTTGIDFNLAIGGRISGRVTDNVTGNGISGVLVLVIPPGGIGATVTSVNTAADGSYTTAGLLGGTYFLRTSSALGFIDEIYDNLPCSGCSNTTAATTGAPVNVVLGATTSNINFGLDHGRRISGTITDASSGVPISGVSVQVVNAAGTQVATATTNASGVYTSGAGLLAGSYFVKTTNSVGYINQVYNGIPCVTCSANLAGTAITVAGTDIAGIDFALSAGSRLTGTVVNALTGLVVPSVSVIVSDATGLTVASGSTNSSGVYTTGAGIPAGSYFVFTSTSTAANLVDQIFDHVNCVVCNLRTPGATAVSVAASGTTTVNFSLTPGATISGTVTTTTGTPLAGVGVDIFDAAGIVLTQATSAADGTYSLTGLAAGSYFLETSNKIGYVDLIYPNLSCSFCQLSGYRPSLVATSGASPIPVAAGQALTGINFQLVVGGQIKGTVRDAVTGQPVVGVAVAFASPGAPGILNHSITDANGAYQTTGLPTGIFYLGFQGSAASPYVQQLYGGINCGACDFTAGAPIQVTLGAVTSGIDLNLVRGGHVSGTVADSTTHEPISGLYVNLFDSTGKLVSYPGTSSGGAYTSVAVLPGTYFARTSTQPPEFTSASVPLPAQGYVPKLFDDIVCAGCQVTTGGAITVQTDQTTTGVNFNLDRGAQISGTVMDVSSAAPIAYATVQFYNSGGVLAAAAITDAVGHYVTADGLPAGSYFARTFNSAGYIDQVKGGSNCVPTCAVTGGTPIVVPSSGILNGVDFALVAGGRISGTVLESTTGQPIRNVTVLVYNGAGAVVGSASSNSLGQFVTASGLVAGQYHVLTSNNLGYVEQLFAGVDCVGCDPTAAGNSVTVALGSTATSVDFSLTPGGRIAGTVTDNNNVPLNGVVVEIWTAPFQRVTTRAITNTLGQYFTLQALPAGAYTARTTNSQGFVNQVYASLVCLVTCDPSSGTSIQVTGTGATSAINFTLSIDPDFDADGINNTIDRVRTTGVDQSGVLSNDFTDVPLGGLTAGTITSRAGWNVTVVDVSPGGVQLGVTGAGSGAAVFDVSQTGGSEQVLLDAPGEVARITTNAADGGTTLTAVAAFPAIQLQKTVGGITTIVDVTTGQTATLGSPAVADPDNTAPLVVRIVDAGGNQIGTFALPAGSSAEAKVAAGGGLQLTVFAGSVTGTLFGQTVTVGEGQTQTLTPPDGTPPVITVPGPQTVEATGPAGAVVNFVVTANDDVDGVVTPSCAPASGSTFALGTTTVTCSAADSHGNNGTKTFSVMVADTTPPAISGTPGTLSLLATSAAGSVATFSTPTAQDTVDGVVGVNCSPASGSQFPIGTTNVVCTAVDAHSNANSSQFSVIVTDPTQVITVTTPAPGSQAFGSGFAVAATGGASGNPVTFSSGGGCSNVGANFTMTSGTVDCTVKFDQAGNGVFNAATQVVEVTHAIKAASTTVPSAATATYSASDLILPLSATVSPIPTGGGTVAFVVLDGATPIGTVGNISFNPTNGQATATFTLPGGTSAGGYTIQATFTGSMNFLNSVGISTLLVSAGNLLGDVAAADADFKHVDGFDVLFGKGSSNTLLKLKNTNPAGFHYQLTLTNETGATLHDKNVQIDDKRGGSVTIFLTVPSLPTSVGWGVNSMPAAALAFTNVAQSAFDVQGNHPVHVYPDDKTDDMPVSIKWLGSLPAGILQCSDVADPDGGSPWTAGQPADGTIVKCIKVEGMAIPKHGKAKVDVNYELALKGIDLWPVDAQSKFMAGFAFKSITTVQLDNNPQFGVLANRTYSGNQAAGLVGAGQQVTALGGFVFDSSGAGVSGATIKVYSAAQTSCASTTGLVTTVTTMADGFYFAPVADGTTWWVGACAPGQTTGSFLAGRTIDHKLAKKEFDEEDFYVIWP